MKNQIQADVERLALPGGRAVGTKGHDMARDYLNQRLRELGIQPYKAESLELPYSASGVSFTNLIGRVPGEQATAKPLLIGAHYDTCGPTPGADDNAAAVGIV